MANQSKYSWRQTKDGYHQEWQYIREGDGSICGLVSGSTYEDSKGWYAAALIPGDRTHLGLYVTIAQAKSAVERHWENPQS